MTIIEAIKGRRSVRNFNGVPLTDSQRNELLEYIGQTVNPFGGNFSIRLKTFDLTGGYKPSTYGMIKGANDFFMVGVDDNEISALATGFCFEQIVLKAWRMGLGTCWIAATFKGTDFDDGEGWPAGQTLRIICPIGTAANQSMMEKITRFALGSRNRKPFGDLFFSTDFTSSLSPDSRFGEALEMLRLAPSSTNSQPWRAIADGNAVHFYYVPKSSLSVLDCGIGLCHFYFTEQLHGRKGNFHKAITPPSTNRNNLKYLISYTADPA